MYSIFLSYRRGDVEIEVEQIARMIRIWFGSGFGYVDRERIAGGADFVKTLQVEIERAAVVLLIIGPNWAGRNGADSLRIAEADDWVRFEVETALKAFPRVRVLPVYVGGAAPFDPRRLPEELARLPFMSSLAKQNGIVIREFSETDPGIVSLQNHLEQAWKSTSQNRPAHLPPNRTNAELVNTLVHQAEFTFLQFNSTGSLVYQTDSPHYQGCLIIKPPPVVGGTLSMGFNPNNGEHSPPMSLYTALQREVPDWSLDQFQNPPQQISVRY